jgi:DMSO/TMAO reductase YedYZ molybdopterin-dependent catalytic subunit
MQSQLTRRHLIRAGLTGATVLAMSRLPASAFADESAEEGQPIPFLDDQPVDPKRPMVKWQDLKDWLTPKAQLFDVSHYGRPKVDLDSFRLVVDGLVDQTQSLTLDEIGRRPKVDVVATLECSGNGAGPGFMGAIGNARWSGIALGKLLKDCGMKPEAIEVAFWGADSGKEKIRGEEYEQNFARSLPIDVVMRDDVILAYELNGEALPESHGAPLRLVVPGWYGIAWAKWLARIEVRDRRLMNRFTARDYVTIRGERKGDRIEWKESSVGPMNTKSLVGRVTRRRDGSVHITGAAWGFEPITSVELKIDDAPWLQAVLDEKNDRRYCWRFWSYDWKNATPGEHTLVSRATDRKGHVQPAESDDAIKLKKTYWEANQQYPRRIKI